MARTYSRDVVLEALAARLGGAWLAQTQFAELDSGEIPKTRAEAYLVADRMAEHIRDHLSGWKVGATSAVMRELDGHSDVIPGRIFRSVTWEGESFTLPTKMFPNARAEAEFAFRLNEDVTDAAINDPEQMAESAVLHPAIELIGNRFSATGLTAEQNSLMTVADNGGGIGFVFGAPVENWRALEFQHHQVRVSLDGGAPSDNFLGDKRGTPLQALCDLGRHLAGRGYRLKTGDYVSTGAACVPQAIGQGSHVLADFGALGKIEVSFE